MAHAHDPLLRDATLCVERQCHPDTIPRQIETEAGSAVTERPDVVGVGGGIGLEFHELRSVEVELPGRTTEPGPLEVDSVILNGPSPRIVSTTRRRSCGSSSGTGESSAAV